MADLQDARMVVCVMRIETIEAKSKLDLSPPCYMMSSVERGVMCMWHEHRTTEVVAHER